MRPTGRTNNKSKTIAVGTDCGALADTGLDWTEERQEASKAAWSGRRSAPAERNTSQTADGLRCLFVRAPGEK
ncbi:hypothetical protein NDU88_001463 [Pleurodeles waltl]|uniref:Uncharacterized protein n=1 Tax=Pleurodeles waltl TaxID=8319 RepID=A0AAV7NFU3_PLEWA|nr:hypothetical protein NDU88_001463 [Pleurodeles waltl]